MIRGQCHYAGRTYVVDAVCMKIYDLENHLIQMVSLAQAQEKFADILEKMACPLDVSGLSLKEKQG
jgi:hypothetical protein